MIGDHTFVTLVYREEVDSQNFHKFRILSFRFEHKIDLEDFCQFSVGI